MTSSPAPLVMDPNTVHLLAQLLRYHRAITGAFDKWARSQPRCQQCRMQEKVLKIVELQRKAFAVYETQLSQMPTEVDSDLT